MSVDHPPDTERIQVLQLIREDRLRRVHPDEPDVEVGTIGEKVSGIPVNDAAEGDVLEPCWRRRQGREHDGGAA